MLFLQVKLFLFFVVNYFCLFCHLHRSVGFSLVGRERGLLFSCGVRASLCGGFSCCRSWALEYKLSSCGTRA